MTTGYARFMKDISDLHFGFTKEIANATPTHQYIELANQYNVLCKSCFGQLVTLG